jgi:hypothetical protein
VLLSGKGQADQKYVQLFSIKLDQEFGNGDLNKRYWKFSVDIRDLFIFAVFGYVEKSNEPK